LMSSKAFLRRFLLHMSGPEYSERLSAELIGGLYFFQSFFETLLLDLFFRPESRSVIVFSLLIRTLIFVTTWMDHHQTPPTIQLARPPHLQL
jgi:hypothetical protein